MKNANLKSKEEMLDMLLTGVHLFDEEGAELCFNKKFVFDGWSGFRRKNIGGSSDPLSGSWTNFAQMQIKTPWQDSISEETPKLCRVWDTDREKARNIYRIINKYCSDAEYPYRLEADMTHGYIYAEPVTTDADFLYREDDLHG